MKCDKCDCEAATFVRYSGAHLCPAHFVDFVERKIKKEVRKQIKLSRGDTLAVAVSGGKDSMVTLSVLDSLFGERNGITVECVTVDEGIVGYRPPSVDIVRDFCAKKGIGFRMLSFGDEFGVTMDDVAPHSGDKSPCTYCGVFRRKCLNILSREVGADCLATGHNLDDMAQSIMMNFARGDIDRLARLGPHKVVKPGMTPRIMPLRTVTEKESLLYALFSGIPFHDGHCPYWAEALRNQYREIVDSLEERSPGAKYSILSSYDTLYPLITSADGVGTEECACGEQSIGGKCQACSLCEAVLGKIRNP